MDEMFATGTSFLKSKGDFKVKRHNNSVFVDGVVTHRWEDLYDFEPMNMFADGAIVLEKEGRAKKFETKSEWQQRMNATMNIQGGKLVRRRITWQNIDRKPEK